MVFEKYDMIFMPFNAQSNFVQTLLHIFLCINTFYYTKIALKDDTFVLTDPEINSSPLLLNLRQPMKYLEVPYSGAARP
jgi:hypothetical protein